MTIYLNVNEQIALLLALLLLILSATYQVLLMFTAYKDRKSYALLRGYSPNWAKILHVLTCLWPAMVIGRILFG